MKKPHAPLFLICHQQLSVDGWFAGKGEYVLDLHVMSVFIQRLMDLVLNALMLLKEEVHTVSELLVLLM